jgi:hypothetical protein
MIREYFSGTIREKLLTIFSYFLQLKFPLFEVMRKLDYTSKLCESIDAVEVIFFKEGGKQYVIEFNSSELFDIMDATVKKNKIHSLETEKRMLQKKIREMQEQIVLLENTI